ncbi:MAG: DNA polymerase III subunit delta [Alphaproteobacteria bacterium]|nr:DNA polymerase III subunit delta [Alphaproteobacteria bacterium]
MRVSLSEADKLTAAPPKAWAAVLVFGANTGLVRERADKCARAIVPDLNDAFRVSDLAGDALRKDPARLTDEAASISMFGGRRVVRVRDAGDALSDQFESYLEHHLGDTLVVVEAGDLAKTSSLRKIFEAAKSGAAIECAEDRPEDAGKLIRESLAEAGWKIEPLALDYLAEALSVDRRLLRTEVEKLSLYLGTAPKDGVLTLAEAANLVGDSGAVEADEIADAVAGGDVKKLDRLVTKTNETGASWGTALNATLRLFQRLLASAEGAAPAWGRSSFYEQRMQAQLSGWTRGGLIRALRILAEAEAQTRTTGLPEGAIAQHALYEVAGLKVTASRR